MADCRGCATIERPYGLVVDHLTAEEVPPEINALIRVAQEAEPRGFPDALERCPICASHFLYEHRIDNDIFQPTDESRWIPVTTERARAWLVSQDAIRENTRKDLAAFGSKARRRWAKLLPTLKSDERVVFDFLATIGADGTTPEAIERRCCIASDLADRVIAGLVEKKVLRETSPDSYRGSRLLTRYAIDV